MFRLITGLTCKEGDYLSHALLVSALLDSKEARPLIEAIAQKNGRDVAWTAANLSAWFSQRYTVGKNSYSSLLERQKIDGAWAYRSLMTTKTASENVDGDFIDVELMATEGALRLVAHLKRERSGGLVKDKLQDSKSRHGVLKCECCGFEADRINPGIGAHIVEVHHVIPLSSLKGSTVTTIDDLAVHCPTCHRAIHRLNDMSVEEVKEKYFSALDQR